MRLSGSLLANSRVISGRPIAPYANDDSCFELSRTWRDICLEKHGGSCFKSTEQTLPTRVIDVGPSDGSRDPTLRITNGERGEWVALSHCWGTASRVVTNSRNVPLSERFMNLGDMPPTFRDAVIVTRQLGYRYLWIDSLCIVQDIHEDWVAESLRMRDYYKHAVLTISADSASGDHVGFLKHRRELRESLTITLTSNDQISVRLPVRPPIFRDRDTYVAERAWTLQEFVLTPRSLLYTSQQIIWDCHTSKFCESDENFVENDEDLFYRSMKRFFSTPSLGKEKFPDFEECFDPFVRWYSLISDYFYRDLTLKKDVLPAISGLAREIHNQTGKTYAAGIWIEELHHALLWITSGCAKIPEAYHAPSWSWASLECLPEALRPALEDLYLTAIVGDPGILEWRACYLSHEIILEDGDPFGCVSSGFIHIRGRLLLTRLWQGKTKPYFNSYKSRFLSHFFTDWPNNLSMDQLVCNYDIIEPDIEEEDHEEKDIEKEDIGEEDTDEENVVLKKLLDKTIMFQVSAWDWGSIVSSRVIVLALLLLPVRDKPADTYRRVGLVEVPNFEGLAEKGWITKEITII